MVETCSVTAADCPCPGFSVHRTDRTGLAARCGRPFFLSAKDTFQRPPATRWTGIFQNFFCLSNPGTGILATGVAENFSFHSPHHRVLKFAKRNGLFSLCFLLRTKIGNAKRRGKKFPFHLLLQSEQGKMAGNGAGTTKKAANLFQTYCFHWPPVGGWYSVLKTHFILV